MTTNGYAKILDFGPAKLTSPHAEASSQSTTGDDHISTPGTHACLEKDVETRYQSATEICADLKRLKRESSSSHAVVVEGRSPPAMVAVV